MSILLSQDFVVGLAFEMFLDAGSLTLMQSNNVVFLPHLVTVNSTKGRSKTAKRGNAENSTILDAIIGLSSEGRANGAVDNTRAAIGYISREVFWTY